MKKTELTHYKAQRYSKALVALNLKGEDELIDVHVTNGESQIFMATHLGYGLWFGEDEVNVVGARAAGVKGINLKEDDFVVSGEILQQSDSIVLFTQRGAVKRMSLSEFEKTSRAKRGVVMLRELKKNPHRVVALFACGLEQRLMAETEKGDRKELQAKELRTNDRYSNGSFFFDEEESGKVTAVWRVR